MALLKHFLSHILQPIQPSLQFDFVVFPLSFDEQATSICFVTGRREIKKFGQAVTHFPHEMQDDLSIQAIPFTIEIASYSHTATQSPRPKQPYEQTPSPL